MKKMRFFATVLSFVLLMTTVLAISPVSAESAGAIAADSTWYNENATELVISDAADFVAFMEALVSKSSITIKESVDQVLDISGTGAFSGKTIKLANDIDLNPGWQNSSDITKYPTTVPATVLTVTGNKGFSGVFDGQGHTVSGLYIDVQKDVKHDKENKIYDYGTTAGSIFGAALSVNGADVVVKDVMFVNSYIRSNNVGLAGVFSAVGSGSSAGIETVYADVDLMLALHNELYSKNGTGGQTSVAVGGLVGTNRGALTVTDTVYAGTMTYDMSDMPQDKLNTVNWRWVAGLVGYASGTVDKPSTSLIENVGFLGYLKWNDKSQNIAKGVGRVENNSTVTFTNCVFAGDIEFGVNNTSPICTVIVTTTKNVKALLDVSNSVYTAAYTSEENEAALKPNLASSGDKTGTEQKATIKGRKVTDESLQGENATLKQDASIDFDDSKTVSDNAAYDLTATWSAMGEGYIMPTALKTLFGDRLRILKNKDAVKLVGYQLSAKKATETDGEYSYSIRLVGTLSTDDISQYSSIGFNISISFAGAADQKVDKDWQVTTVYSSLNGQKKDGQTVVYQAGYFGANHICGLNINEFLSSYGAVTFTVKPFTVDRAGVRTDIDTTYHFTVEY